jgi:hypothetical protein
MVQTQILQGDPRHSARLVAPFTNSLQATEKIITSDRVAQRSLFPDDVVLLKVFFDLLADWDAEAASE